MFGEVAVDGRGKQWEQIYDGYARPAEQRDPLGNKGKTGRAKRQARAVQSLGFSEAEDPVAHAKALGMGLLDSLTGRDQFAKGNDAWEHGEKWEAVGRYTAGISAIVSNVAPVAAAKAARAVRVTKSTRAAVGAAEAAQAENAAGDLGKLASTCNRCFAAGTPIATAEGEKPIEEIVIGDEVWARNLETTQIELAKVVNLFQRSAEGVIQIDLSDGASDGILQVTSNHPLFAPGRGWIEARELEVGSELLGLDGKIAIVKGVAWRPGPVRVYNFEVQGHHNYFAGEVEILVHNACFPSAQSVEIDIVHVLDGHSAGGVRALQSGRKSLWPEAMTATEIEKAIRKAYGVARKVAAIQVDFVTGQRRVKLMAPWEGAKTEIEMWLNITEKRIESAYPKWPKGNS